MELAQRKLTLQLLYGVSRVAALRIVFAGHCNSNCQHGSARCIALARFALLYKSLTLIHDMKLSLG